MKNSHWDDKLPAAKSRFYHLKKDFHLIQPSSSHSHTSHLLLSTLCLYADTFASSLRNKTSNSGNKKWTQTMKCNVIRHQICSCLSSLQLWSDEGSQSDVFRKSHRRPPLFLSVLSSSAVKHIMVSRAVIKKKIDVSVFNALLGLRCSTRRICAAEVFLQNGIFIIFGGEGVAACSLTNWLAAWISGGCFLGKCFIIKCMCCLSSKWCFSQVFLFFLFIIFS